MQMMCTARGDMLLSLTLTAAAAVTTTTAKVIIIIMIINLEIRQSMWRQSIDTIKAVFVTIT